MISSTLRKASSASMIWVYGRGPLFPHPRPHTTEAEKSWPGTGQAAETGKMCGVCKWSVGALSSVGLVHLTIAWSTEQRTKISKEA